MKYPPGKTEEEVLAAIEKAVRMLAPSFVFGYFGIDDISQQARLYGLQAIASGKYDPARPLENWLYIHIRNRLINLRRDKLRRSDPPCRRCHDGNPCGETGTICQKYAEWLGRNNSKANLMQPINIDHVSDEKESRARLESTVVQDAELNEVIERIDAALPVELRATYLQMRAGVSVPRARREAVMEAVRAILGMED